LGYSNPAKEGISEARQIWPESPRLSLVSIGAGKMAAIDELDNVMKSHKESTSKVGSWISGIVMDCDRIADEVWVSCKYQDIEYYRLNIEYSLDGLISWDIRNEQDQMSRVVERYLDSPETVKMMKDIARSLADSPQKSTGKV
jgi:hypothetical protein